MDENRTTAMAAGGYVDAGKADRVVWLMKCPSAVAQSWNSLIESSDSFSLAKVGFSLDPLHPDDTSSRKFTMRLRSADNGHAPKSYCLNMTKDFLPMCVFSETNTVKLAVEGKIGHKFDMKPHEENIEEYGKLCRERTNKSMIRSRQTQMYDNDSGVHMTPMPGMVGLAPSNAKDKRKSTPLKQSDAKRTRRDRGELEDIMFKLFEKQPNWALKQLVLETDQPAQFLKEVLNELCIYNKRGANQGTYELKPEYKKTVEDNGLQ